MNKKIIKLFLLLNSASFLFGSTSNELAEGIASRSSSLSERMIVSTDKDNILADIKSSTIPLHSSMKHETQCFFIKLGYTILADIKADRFDYKTTKYANELNACEDLKDLNLFLYAPSVSLILPSLSIKKGWSYIFSNETADQERQSYLTAVISVMWALVHKSIEQDELFERGAFTLIDPNHKIKNFLLEYVKLANPDLRHFNNFGYDRNPQMKYSSHHRQHSPESQFGIDIRFLSSQGVLKLLPFNYSHILFGKLDFEQDEKLTFLKLESVGIGNLACMVAHGANATMAMVETVQNSWRREKDIPALITMLYKEATHRNSPNETIKTIHQMYADIKKQPEGEIKAKVFKEAVEILCNKNHVSIRTGNEVILDLTA